VRPHRAHDAAQKIDLPCERVIAAPLRQHAGRDDRWACRSIAVGHLRRNALRLLRPTGFRCR